MLKVGDTAQMGRPEEDIGHAWSRTTNRINAGGTVSYVYVKHNTYEEDSVYALQYGDSNISIF